MSQENGVEFVDAAGDGGAHRGSPAVQQGNGGTVNRADPIEAYEKELENARWWAFIISSLHASSRFFSKCNLICATVVLLGAFAQSLVPVDFYAVVSLLLLDAARLYCASFSTQLLRHALASLSQDPKKIHHSQDKHYPRAWLARLLLLLAQIVVYVPWGLYKSSTQLFFEKLDVYKSIDNARNLQNSLRMFYGSVFFNAILALITLICSAIHSKFVLRRNSPTEQSIVRYYDKLLENAMAFGVMKANDFEFFRFAFEMLGAEFGRNVQAKAVAKNHKQLVHYMYAHRVGVDFVEIYLNAEDAYQQLAAVNVVGFWADRAWGVGVPTLRLPEELLTKLADKVGTGQVGWAASSSFGAIAASSPQGAKLVEQTCTSKGVPLVDRLAHLVDNSSSRSLSLVRTLVMVYEQLCVEKKQAPPPFNGSEFTDKLKKLAKEAERHRLRVQAAYLLHLMNEACGTSDIRGINPTNDAYWFQSEVKMFQFLRAGVGDEPFVFLDPKRPEIYEDHNNISPPRWAA